MTYPFRLQPWLSICFPPAPTKPMEREAEESDLQSRILLMSSALLLRFLAANNIVWKAWQDW